MLLTEFRAAMAFCSCTRTQWCAWAPPRQCGAQGLLVGTVLRMFGVWPLEMAQEAQEAPGALAGAAMLTEARSREVGPAGRQENQI